MSGGLLLDPTPGHEDAVEFIGWAGLYIVRMHVCVGWVWSPVKSSQVRSGQVRSNSVKSSWVGGCCWVWCGARKKEQAHAEAEVEAEQGREPWCTWCARPRRCDGDPLCLSSLVSFRLVSFSFFLPPAPLVLHPELVLAVRSLDPCGYPFGSLAH
jgi:hypothetical protein